MAQGLLVLRLIFGIVMAAHGAQKLFGWFGGYGLNGTGGYFESLGFRPGRFFAFAAGASEFAGGLLVAIGLFGPIGPALVLATMIVTAFAHAATVDPSLFQDLRWRLIGPFRGGRVLAVTGVPNEPEHFYFGSVNGGVWETRDAGRTWQPIFDSQPIGSIGAIAVAPSNPKVIYVGSGESDMRSDIAQGNGMYRSTDGGKTWSHIGLADSQQIARIRVHPSDPNLVYVCALGHPYGSNTERGVFRWRDGGATWTRILSRFDAGAIDLAFEPGNPNVVYAALWETRRPPWSVYPPSNGPDGGLFKSTGGGDHWTEIRGK